MKMITRDLEYSEVMEEIAELMGRNPLPDSVEAERLRELAIIAHTFERKRHRLPVTDPITAIRFRMEQSGLEPRDLVPYIGTRSRVSEVLSGKRPLTLSMIRNLHRGLGIPAESLIAEPTVDNTDRTNIDWVRFPIVEMRNRGWIDSASRSHVDDMNGVIRFLSPVLDAGFGTVLFRKSTSCHVRSAQTADWYALVAWTARVVSLARENPTSVKYQPGTITPEFLRRVTRLSWSERGPRLAEELLRANGIGFVVERQLPGTRLDGAAIALPSLEPVIGLTLRFDRIDNFWFTLMHELAHLALHLADGAGAFYDDLEALGEDKAEREADQLADDTLVPADRLKDSKVMSNPSPFLVDDLARELEIHPAIVAGRVRHAKGNYRLLSKHVGQGGVHKLFPEIKW